MESHTPKEGCAKKRGAMVTLINEGIFDKYRTLSITQMEMKKPNVTWKRSLKRVKKKAFKK